MYYNNKLFKRYDDDYFVSCNGDVYSKITNKILKHYIDKDGYHRVDIHGKHIKVHKLVWMTWCGSVPKGLQLNHKDDNKNRNNFLNLYLGSQKDNILDSVKNGSRVGNIIAFKIYDSHTDKAIWFPSGKHFILYSGHNCSSGSIKKIIKTKWFKKRYVLLSQKRVETIEEYNDLVSSYLVE